MEFWRYKDKAILDKQELKRFSVKCSQPPKLCVATKEVFELNFVVYKAAYKQVEANVTKKEPKDSKSQEKNSEAKKIDLAIIKTLPGSPIQEVMCREEHKKLFEGLWERKQRS